MGKRSTHNITGNTLSHGLRKQGIFTNALIVMDLKALKRLTSIRKRDKLTFMELTSIGKILLVKAETLMDIFIQILMGIYMKVILVNGKGDKKKEKK
jgi:hypothetical protein